MKQRIIPLLFPFVWLTVLFIQPSNTLAARIQDPESPATAGDRRPSQTRKVCKPERSFNLLSCFADRQHHQRTSDLEKPLAQTPAKSQNGATNDFDVKLFYDSLESGTGNWSSNGFWHLVTRNSHSPAHSFWYGQDASGDYDNGATNSGSVTMSAPFSLSSSLSVAHLAFWSWESTECYGPCSWDTRKVFLSTNGTIWTQVWMSNSLQFENWYRVQIDLSPWIGSSIYLRFEFDTVDDVSNDYEGWYIDDIAIGYNFIDMGMTPEMQGQFGSPEADIVYPLKIYNMGSNNDTYNLSGTSAWPLTWYDQTGTTPLTDSDGDFVVDTGTVSSGSVVTVTAQVSVPIGGVIGDANTANVTATSSESPAIYANATLQGAIPASFAQVYSDDADGAMSLYIVQPLAQTLKKATPDMYSGDDVAIAESPDRLAYFWSKFRQNGNLYVGEIEYSLYNQYGETVRGVSKLTNHSGTNMDIYDENPVIAFAPNGRLGVLWTRYMENNLGQFNYNLYFAILENSGDLVYGPTNLTNNTIWGYWFDLNTPYLYDPKIAATDDDRYVLAWGREHEPISNGWVNDIYYAIRDTNGGVIKAVTKFTADTPGWDEGYYDPNLTRLNNDRVLLTWERDSDTGIYYTVLNSAGNTIKSTTKLTSVGLNWAPDAAQLSDGRIAVAWTGDGFPNDQIYFAILDTSYNLMSGPTPLVNSASFLGDDYVSVAADGNGHAILTWMDRSWSYRSHLYYALVNSSGAILTQPIIFRSSQASDPYLETSYLGYGNAPYSWSAPSQMDGVINFSRSVFGDDLSGIAAVGIGYANHGAQTATGVVLTASLDSDLTYLSDTSGFTPILSGDDVVWELPDLEFLENHEFTLYVQLPPGAIPLTRYPIALELTLDGSEWYPDDNVTEAEVVATTRVFLPIILRKH